MADPRDTASLLEHGLLLGTSASVAEKGILFSFLTAVGPHALVSWVLHAEYRVQGFSISFLTFKKNKKSTWTWEPAAELQTGVPDSPNCD